MITALELLHEAEIAIALSVGSWVVLFPIRTLFKKFRIEWEEKTKMLEQVHDELITQRTNCLTTLQSQGREQITVLERMSDTLEQMHLDQKETAGFLKGLK